jgi:hypothetical protein
MASPISFSDVVIYNVEPSHPSFLWFKVHTVTILDEYIFYAVNVIFKTVIKNSLGLAQLALKSGTLQLEILDTCPNFQGHNFKKVLVTCLGA